MAQARGFYARLLDYGHLRTLCVAVSRRSNLPVVSSEQAIRLTRPKDTWPWVLGYLLGSV